MNVFELLKKDHQTARDLFAQLERADRDERAPLFDRLRHELTAHAHAEQQAFYSRLENIRQTHDDVEEGLDEHHAIEAMLDELADLDARSDDFMREARRLRDCVEHHVQEEENKMFIHARQALPDDRLNELGDAVEEAKRHEEEDSSGQ